MPCSSSTAPAVAVGEALLADQRIAGVAFTGSSEVGMRIVRRAAEGTGAGPCPVVVEMGGKNACDRHRHGRPRRCRRSGRALGLRLRRAEVQRLLPRLRRARGGPTVSRPADAAHRGDAGRRPGSRRPGARTGHPGRSAVAELPRSTSRASSRRVARFVCGGEVLAAGELAHGHYVAPTSPDFLYRSICFFPKRCSCRSFSFKR